MNSYILYVQVFTHKRWDFGLIKWIRVQVLNGLVRHSRRSPRTSKIIFLGSLTIVLMVKKYSIKRVWWQNCRLTDFLGQISNAYSTFPPGIPRMRIFAIEPSSGTSTASDCLDSTTELVGQNSGHVVTFMSKTRLRF